MHTFFRTIDTHVGQMYACARQISQGRQHTYVISELNDNIFSPSNMQRSNHFNMQRSNQYIGDGFMQILKLTKHKKILYTEEDSDDEINDYVVSDVMSPYRTNSAIKMMRSVSGNNSIGRDLNEDI